MPCPTWVYSKTPALCSTGCANQSQPHPTLPNGPPWLHPKSCSEPQSAWEWHIPTLQRMRVLYSVTWPSHDEHATMQLAGHLISRPGSLGFQPLFHSICSILQIDASCIALYPLCLCLLSIPDLVSNCMHPCVQFMVPSPSSSCGQLA